MELLLGPPQSHKPPKLFHECQICDDISKCLAGTLGYYQIYDLGLLKDLITSTCITHSSFLQTLRPHLDESSSALLPVGSIEPFGRWRLTDRLELSYHVASSRLASDPDSRVQLQIYRHNPKVPPEESGIEPHQVHHLLLVKRGEVKEHPGNACIPDEDWIDPGRIRAWIDRCCQKHGQACENTMRIIRRPPKYLVDVQKMRVVDGKPEHRYFALSYRIGRPGTFIMYSKDLEELRSEHALSRPDIFGQLQLTVQHALNLTRMLGADYLWVDVLCIVHGEASTADQLNDMASIYSNAWTTIIVADGQGSDGIRGLRNISESRNLQQPVLKYRDERLLLESQNRDDLDTGRPYFKRAWTHQEFKMSCRKLIIKAGQAHWKCATYTHHEYLVDGQGQRKRNINAPTPTVSGIPDLQFLVNSELAPYNIKDLTYPQDAQVAASGLLAVYSRTFDGGFLYGLPESHFDAALGWDPGRKMVRRRKSADPAHIPLGPCALPSWSWIGWKGMFRLRSNEPSSITFMHQPGRILRETSPITDWYTGDNPEGRCCRRIRSCWLRDRDNFKDLGQTLLEGWTRIAAKDLDLIEGKKCPQALSRSGVYVYEHQGISRYYRFPKFWKHPFPISSIDSSTPLTSPEQTRYLFCRTWKTSVCISAGCKGFRRDRFSGSSANAFNVHSDVHGPVIGKLRMNEPPFECDDRKFDVIAISKLVDHEFIPTVQDYRMIKVLWVRWETGIAYRHGSGEVDEDAWYNLPREEIDLVLG